MPKPPKKKEEFQPLWGHEKNLSLRRRIDGVQTRVLYLSGLAFMLTFAFFVWLLGFDPKEMYPIGFPLSAVFGYFVMSKWKYPTE